MQSPHDGDRPATFPVFVLSSERSGSTLFRYVLDTHAELYCPDELSLGRTAMHLALFIEGANGRALAPDPNRPYALSPATLRETRAIIEATLAPAVRARGKRLWCEKSPHNLNELEVIQLVFPDARYIGLFRHPLDFIRSALTACRFGFWPGLIQYVTRHPDNFVEAMARAWIEKTRKVLSVETALPGALLRVRYEDLVCAPEATVASIEAFLGLAHDPDLLARVFKTDHPQRAGFGDENARYSTQVHINRLGLGREIAWQQGISAESKAEIGELIAQLGYPPLPDHGVEYSLGVEPQAAEGPTAVGSVAAFLDRDLPDYLEQYRDALPPLDGAFRVRVTGAEVGEWVLDGTGPAGPVVRKDGEAATTVIVDAGAFLRVVNAEVSPLEVAQEGLLTAEGLQDPMALQKVVALLIAAAAGSGGGAAG